MGSRTFFVPVDHTVVMYGNTVDQFLRNISHQYFRPVKIFTTRTNRDAEQAFVVIIRCQHGGVSLVQVYIVIHIHVATTIPRLIANTPVFYMPWFCSSCLFAEFSNSTGTIGMSRIFY